MRHQISFMCDDIHKTMADLRAKGVSWMRQPKTQSYGITTQLHLPGGCEAMLYQPRHAIAAAITTRAAGEEAGEGEEEGRGAKGGEEIGALNCAQGRRAKTAASASVNASDSEFTQCRCRVGGGPSGKHVAEVAVASRAQDLDAHHAVAAIALRRPRSRPRSAGRSSASRCLTRTSRSTQTAAARSRCRCRRRRACCRAACRRTAAPSHARVPPRTAAA